MFNQAVAETVEAYRALELAESTQQQLEESNRIKTEILRMAAMIRSHAAAMELSIA